MGSRKLQHVKRGRYCNLIEMVVLASRYLLSFHLILHVYDIMMTNENAAGNMIDDLHH